MTYPDPYKFGTADVPLSAARRLHDALGHFLNRGVRVQMIEEALQTEREQGREEAVQRMQAMRRDYRTLPHAEFPIKWPDWRDYDEVLPAYCGCQDCRLWRSGS